MVDKDFFEGFSTLEDTSEDSLKYKLGEETLILKIEIGKQLEQLIVHKGEPPEEAVKKFCIKHGLQHQIEKVLLNKIIENTAPSSSSSIPKQSRFIKKGNFIKKEIPVRGRSVLSSTNATILKSPDKHIIKEEVKRYGKSPETRNRSSNNHSSRTIKPNQSNRL
jgi:hypothetical protein